MNISFLLLSMVSISSLFNIFFYGYFQFPFFYTFLISQSIFTFIISLQSRFKYNLPNILNLFIFLNLLFLLISSTFQGVFYPASRAIGLISGITSFYFIGNNISKRHLFLFFKFLAICFFIAAIICLISSPLKLFQYSGYFVNPNKLGRLFSYFFIIFGTFMLKFRKEISSSTSIIYSFIIFTSFVFISLSSARTSIISSLLPFFLYFIYLIFKKIRLFLKYRRKKDFKHLIILLGLFLIISVIGINYYNFINTKSIFKILQRGDFTGGRLIIWNLTLNQITNWGIDLTECKRCFLEFFGMDPHSTYLNFALQNGLIPSVIFFTSLFFSIIKITLISNYKLINKYYFVYFLSIQTFTYWIFESANALLTFWLIFFFLAYESRENKFNRQKI